MKKIPCLSASSHHKVRVVVEVDDTPYDPESAGAGYDPESDGYDPESAVAAEDLDSISSSDSEEIYDPGNTL